MKNDKDILEIIKERVLDMSENLKKFNEHFGFDDDWRISFTDKFMEDMKPKQKTDEELNTELDINLKAFRELLPTLQNNVGKFTLFKDTKLIEIFDTYADACKVGYLVYKLGGFSIFQIESI